MIVTAEHINRIAKMTFGKVFPYDVTKVEKKGRTVEGVYEVIEWLADIDES